jgi:hypothetical protein
MTSETEPEPDYKNNSTPDAGREPDIQTNNSNNRVAPNATRSEPPPTPSHCEITCKPEKNWWNQIKPFVEIAGIGILGIYTIFTALMYRANRKAANAAEGANVAAHDALVRSQRPWVGVVGTPTISRVTKDERTVEVQPTFRVKNYGPSPALYLNLVPEGGGIPEYPWIAGYQAPAPTVLACKIAEDVAKGHLANAMRNGKTSPIKVPAGGFTVFPNEPLDLSNSMAGYSQPENPKSGFTFYGCIAYGDQFGKVIHHTPFCYQSTTPSLFQYKMSLKEEAVSNTR